MTESDITRKIQALLAKAEKSEFTAESEAFFAKATELMLKYAIDEAKVREGLRDGSKIEEPVKDRISYDYNFAQAKTHLIGVLGRANRVRVIIDNGAKNTDPDTGKYDWHNKESRRACFLVGYPRDVANLKMLYTSLLIQASREGLKSFKGTKVESDHQAKVAGNYFSDGDWNYCGVCSRRIVRSPSGTGFRHQKEEGQIKFMTSFVYGFATVVGKRLREREESVRVEDPSGMGLVDLSKERVDSKVNELFGPLRQGKSSSVSGSGFASGAASGQSADIGNPGVSSGLRRQIGG